MSNDEYDKKKKVLRTELKMKWLDKINKFKEDLAKKRGFKSYNKYLKGE